MLLSDNEIRTIKIRTLEELKAYWEQNHSVITHVIIMGHGEKDGSTRVIGDQGNLKIISAGELMNQFNLDGVTPKTFVSLSCYSGNRGFGGEASNLRCCEYLLGLHGVVHGAVASQFMQIFFSIHLLKGKSIHVAYKNSRKLLQSFVKIRCWENGSIYRS